MDANSIVVNANLIVAVLEKDVGRLDWTFGRDRRIESAQSPFHQESPARPRGLRSERSGKGALAVAALRREPVPEATLYPLCRRSGCVGFGSRAQSIALVK